MSAWDLYQARIEQCGSTRRNASKHRFYDYVDRKLPDNLSFQIADVAGVERSVAIINSDNLNQKYIYSMPGEDLPHGGLVHWMDNYWLITDKDVANEIYSRAVMLQCNYLLKWIDAEHVIHEQWCIVEDGTKYLTGEFEDKYFVTTRGDTRMYLTIGRNEYTAKLNRKTRFLIDDPLSEDVMAYSLTKPLKVGATYGTHGADSITGVLKFVIQEVNTTDDDNLELMIPDYYKHFPRQSSGDPGHAEEPGKKVWL